MTDQEVLRLIRDRLSSIFKIERLILFGSRASGRVDRLGGVLGSAGRQRARCQRL